MSEKEPTYESGQEVKIDAAEIQKIKEAAERQTIAEAKKAEANRESLEKIRLKIEKVALTEEEAEVDRIKDGGSESILTAGKHIKDLSYKQTIRSTQRKEKPLTRQFSKLIHQPVVEELSTLAEGTVARPSGLLVGGLFSVISSLAILYIARYYGYEYNFLVGLASFVGGFALGLLVEGIWRILKPRRQ